MTRSEEDVTEALKQTANTKNGHVLHVEQDDDRGKGEKK